MAFPLLLLDREQSRSWTGTFLFVVLVFFRAMFEGLRIVMITNLVGFKDKNSRSVLLGEALSICEASIYVLMLLHSFFCNRITAVVLAALAVVAPCVSPLLHLWGTLVPERDAGYLRITPYSAIAIFILFQAIVVATTLMLPPGVFFKRMLPFCPAALLTGRWRVYVPVTGASKTNEVADQV